MNKITVVGSYNKGLTITTNRIPNWGETLAGKNFVTSHGGKGSNQAVAAKRLGAEVNFIGALGSDDFGKGGHEMFNRENLNVSGVKTIDNENTGVGIIFLDESGGNSILIDKGANRHVTKNYVEDFKYLIEEADVLVVQLEIPLEAVEHAMKIAKDKGVLVILNPAPAVTEAKKLIQYADVINPNETELLLLNNMSPSQLLEEEECIYLAKKLLKKGPQDVIVTRGEKGAIHVTREITNLISAQPVESKDSTGAGDAFTGALAYSLSNNKTVQESLNIALAAGTYCVTKYSVLGGMTDYNTLKKFMEGKNEKSIPKS